MTAANDGLWLSHMSFFKPLFRLALIAPFLVATANAVILDWNTGSCDPLRKIVATSVDGTTQIAATITTSANNSLPGSGLTQVVDGTATTVDTGA